MTQADLAVAQGSGAHGLDRIHVRIQNVVE